MLLNDLSLKAGRAQVDLGLEDVGMRGLEDSGMRGRWDAGTFSTGGRKDVGSRGRDKETTPDFCAEFVKYNFLWS